MCNRNFKAIAILNHLQTPRSPAFLGNAGDLRLTVHHSFRIAIVGFGINLATVYLARTLVAKLLSAVARFSGKRFRLNRKIQVEGEK
jgi:hypothetical protein